MAGSTLLALLAGMTSPDEGQVLVGGRLLDEATADSWRASLAFIPQQPHFRNAPLRNILADAQTLEQIVDALQMAKADEIVSRLPEGLDTVIGERGFGISAGEARRLLVAQAILRNAKVILADEPTADLDHMSADAISHALLQMHTQGATLIVATHDKALAGRMVHQVAFR